MAIKKNSSNVKKSTTSGKRHAKLIVPKGEKVSSMKTVDVSSPVLFKNCTQVHH
jgi:hypothetical protein